MITVASAVIMDVRIQVEMFGVTADETGDESSQLLDEFVSLQKDMFSALGLHYRLVALTIAICAALFLNVRSG